MSDLMVARVEMGVSLAFHIVFAVIGIAMPAFMVVSEILWRRTGDAVYLQLTKSWARGTAIFFAVGAVSGTVLSFELGLLWPRFMGDWGAIIGLPFALEGFAFFTEAIFLGIYLYGWERVSPRLHVVAGLLVAASGLASAAFVVMANAWMNSPAGFRLEAGKIVGHDPVGALLNPAALHEIIHVALSTYVAVGFAVAGIHARLLLREPGNRFHERALAITLAVGGAAALLTPVSGHLSAQEVARLQPAKLAALEGQFATTRRAPLRIGGFPDPATRTTRFAIEIPCGLSFLAFNDPNAEVKGLDAFPLADQPETRVVHVAFQLMVGAGSWLALLAVLAIAQKALKKKDPWQSKLLLRALVLSTPLGFLAVEAGWVVTEVGRQPWIVQGILRTKDAVTPVEGLVPELACFVALYAGLAVVVTLVVRKNMGESHA